jgi:hypothetical protein
MPIQGDSNSYNRPEGGWRYDFKGIKTNASPDELQPTKFPYAQNVRKVKSLQTRPGYELLFGGNGVTIATACPLPTGSSNSPYSVTLVALLGTPPYTWTITSGALPVGLTLDPITGIIAGTPTGSGTFTFVIKVTDFNGGSFSKSCQMDLINCSGSEFSLYASGAICPTATKVELYSDDFAYSDFAVLPNPPWTQYTNNGSVGSTIIEDVTTISGNKVVRGSFNGGGGITVNCWRGTMYNAGYTNFDTTPCGVYTEIIFDNYDNSGGGSGGVCGGLAIGWDDGTGTTDRIAWCFGNGQGPVVFHTTNWTVGQTSYFATPAPVFGDKCRLQLYQQGAFGYKLEAFINDVSVGSTVSGTIQLANTKPKSIGFWFGGNRLAFLVGLHSMSMRRWRGGVF